MLNFIENIDIDVKNIDIKYQYNKYWSNSLQYAKIQYNMQGYYYYLHLFKILKILAYYLLVALKAEYNLI